MLPFRLRQARSADLLYRLSRSARQHWKALSFVLFLVLLELAIHIRSFRIPRPATDLDPPFHVGCQEPIQNAEPRANATLMMLARNSDMDGAVASVKNVQKQFNKQFGYPWVFLNDQPWTDEFVTKVTEAGSGAAVRFETISAEMWGSPQWIDKKRARESMDDMQRQGIMYGGVESYHHMCRFQSGSVSTHIFKTHADLIFIAFSTITLPSNLTSGTGASNPIYRSLAP
jgi:mannosyltransferase